MEKVKGTMIIAKRTTDQRRVTRNSSHYKKFKAGSQYVQDPISWDFEKEDIVKDSASETEKTPIYRIPSNLTWMMDQLRAKVDALEGNQFGQKTTS